MKVFLSIVFLFLFIGCAAYTPIKETSQLLFTYDYTIDGKTKLELWQSARDYFKTEYGKDVVQVADETACTILGNALYEYNGDPLKITSIPCLSEYHIRFMAKDGKARLQLEIINGKPALSQCGFNLPPEKAYQDMINYFNGISAELKQALKSKSGLDNF